MNSWSIKHTCDYKIRSPEANNWFISLNLLIYCRTAAEGYVMFLCFTLYIYYISPSSPSPAFSVKFIKGLTFFHEVSVYIRTCSFQRLGCRWSFNPKSKLHLSCHVMSCSDIKHLDLGYFPERVCSHILQKLLILFSFPNTMEKVPFSYNCYMCSALLESEH